MKELFIVLSVVWSIISLAGIVDVLIYKRCRQMLQATAFGSAFERFYVFRLHRWLDYILSIGSRMTGIVWSIVAFLQLIKEFCG